VVERLLIKDDIALDIKDKTGATPLDICCTGTGADLSQINAIGSLLEVRLFVSGLLPDFHLFNLFRRLLALNSC
jgi:hypothetical protein